MNILNIGMESIAFQSGAFFKALTLIIEDMRASGIHKVEELGKFAVRIDQCIYEHSGIMTTTRFLQNYANDYICVPSVTRGNVLNSTGFNKFLKEKFNPEKMSFYNLERTGWIDPANARVSGAFSMVNFKMYLGDMDMVSKHYTPEESASVILHEVGHAYTFLQFLADSVVVNTVLQRTYEELTNGTADKKVKLILTKAANDMNIEGREWLQAVSDTTDCDVAFRLLATAVNIEPRAMDNKRFFSQDACEELAEIFSIRHGAGRALLTMRSKSVGRKINYTGLYMTAIGFAVAGMLVAPLAPVAGFPMAAVGIMATLQTATNHVQAVSSLPDITSFKQSATKIRNQFVEQIKTAKLPKEEIAAIVDSIELADKLIQGYSNDFDPGSLARFLDMFRREKMDARSSREYTDKLEVLVANDLFIRAAQLAAR
jgi:hypothetical protein